MELFLNVGPRMCMQMSKPFIITALKKPGHKIDTLITNHIIEDINRGISCLCCDFHIQLIFIPLWSVTAGILEHLKQYFCNLICERLFSSVNLEKIWNSSYSKSLAVLPKTLFYVAFGHSIIFQRKCVVARIIYALLTHLHFIRSLSCRVVAQAFY